MSYSLLATIICGLVFATAVCDCVWASYKKRGNYKRPFYLVLATIWLCVVGIYFEGNEAAKSYSETITWAITFIGIICGEMDFKVNHNTTPVANTTE